MKKVFSVAAVIAISAFASLPATASIVFQDSFNSYTPNATLNGQGGWSATPTTAATVTSGGLSANGINGGSQKITFSGNSPNAAIHSFASTDSSTSGVYFSFLLDFSGVLNSNDFFALWIDSGSSSTDHTNVPNMGLKVDRGDGSGQEDYFIRLSGTDGVFSDTHAVVGTTVQLVGHLYNNGSGIGFNQFDLWVDPNFQDLGTPDIFATSPNGLTSISRLGVRTANLESGDRVLFDELKVATEWGSVVTPEPISLLVWGGLALAAGVAIRKRS